MLFYGCSCCDWVHWGSCRNVPWPAILGWFPWGPFSFCYLVPKALYWVPVSLESVIEEVIELMISSFSLCGQTGEGCITCWCLGFDKWKSCNYIRFGTLWGSKYLVYWYLFQCWLHFFFFLFAKICRLNGRNIHQSEFWFTT